MKNNLTQVELKRILHYDPDTGIFTWRISRRAGTARAGTVAGHVNTKGYVVIKIKSRGYKAHRLAFLYMKGYFPEHQVDHKLGARADNSWSGLRHATQTCNSQNRGMNKNNSSGFPGVTWEKAEEKWVSQIQINRKGVKVGRYNDPLEAALARFTVEVQCKNWTCNYRSELVLAIKRAWPEFNPSEG